MSGRSCLTVIDPDLKRTVRARDHRLALESLWVRESSPVLGGGQQIRVGLACRDAYARQWLWALAQVRPADALTACFDCAAQVSLRDRRSTRRVLLSANLLAGLQAEQAECLGA